ncbi:hypothetical protein Pfo_013137 [Paulownia fortunei]|nr:hypothetical protein Pfo_013137 [Paulownia fortunei]
MASQSSILLSMSSTYNSISCSSKKPIANTNVIRPTKLFDTTPISFPTPPPASNLSRDFSTIDELTCTISTNNDYRNPMILQPCSHDTGTATAKLYAILEAVADRVEMHTNIGEQRNNWNSLLLNSINMITLTATTMVGLTAAAGEGQPVFTLKLSSVVLFAAATGLLMVVNKLQPSQLVEEQRNATRLFKQLHEEIQTMLALSDNLTEMDVKYMMERVLALDKAYPLPLIGVMLEKFPAKLEPAVWWPLSQFQKGSGELNLEHYQETYNEVEQNTRNGWTDEMENEMREIVHVLKRKDKQDYIRLGNIALKLNKVLSTLGPLFTGMAAVGSALSDSSSLGIFAMAIAVGAGALSTIVNSIEHGGQVGMVFEMYRNCAGFYQLMEETIESSIGEREVSRRENGELMEMKVALQLGRSLSQLKGLAMASASSREDGKATDEFASKLL